jgi:hypothetical protein
MSGNRDCGSVARLTAVGEVGKYSGPDCPQPANMTMIDVRPAQRIKICFINSMVKL